MPIPDSMPVSRPILIALAAALLALVAFAASSTMRGGEESSAPAPKQTQAPAPKPAKPDAAKSSQAPDTQQSKASEPAPSQADGKAVRRTAAAGDETEAGVAARVQRAVDRGRTVVLFFYQRGGADDSATAESVASLRGRRGVAVFTAPVSRLGDFRAVTGSLGISQAPAVVIVGKQGKDRKARVVEGFIDSQTLAQEVADAR